MNDRELLKGAAEAERIVGVALMREPFKLDPPPIYDEHYAATRS
jgi:hypothetical protein